MRFASDKWLLSGLLALTAIALGRVWLHAHPRYDPWAPLALEDTGKGWLARGKLAALRNDLPTCRAFLRRSDIDFTPLPATGDGACRRADRQVLTLDGRSVTLKPSRSQATCAIEAGLTRWLVHGVQPAATALLGTKVVAIEHLGTNNCRRIGGGSSGSWSEHATGNAIDVAAFRLADGRRIVVRRDWGQSNQAAAFLHAARDAACSEFATVLSPEYNAAHADHLHLDQARRGSIGPSYCR